MTTATLTTRVDAPVDVTFATYSDFRSAPRHVSGIKDLQILTDGPVGVGTRMRETRVVFKREATEEMEITAFVPSEKYSVRCNSCGCLYDWAFCFAPDGDGTTVSFEMASTPVTFLAKLTAPLARLASRAMLKCVKQDLDELRAVAESQARTGASG